MASPIQTAPHIVNPSNRLYVQRKVHVDPNWSPGSTVVQKELDEKAAAWAKVPAWTILGPVRKPV